MKDILKTVIADQLVFIETADDAVQRPFPDRHFKHQEVVVISGIRRSGKSTLMQQIRRKQKEKDYYLNFDDERLVNFTVKDFQTLYELFIELFGVQKTFYFDEIQNVSGWERFVRRLYDQGCKVFVTGSNAKMLSRELGTHLTGRYVQHELFPFSFNEFIAFKRHKFQKRDLISTIGRAQIKALFNEYMTQGGFPVFLKTKENDTLRYLFETILYKDIMVRNKLTNEKEMLELVFFLASNAAKTSSYNSLTKITGVKNATTIKNYLSFLQDSYMLFQINKFDYSVKKQIQNAKKTYFIDTAFVKRLGFNFSENTGRLLENIVFVELKRRKKEVYYYQNKFECDFVIRDGYHVKEAIQVCNVFEDEKTKKREISGLLEAMTTFSLDSGLILTMDTEETIAVDDKIIQMIPVWKWLLEN